LKAKNEQLCYLKYAFINSEEISMPSPDLTDFKKEGDERKYRKPFLQKLVDFLSALPIWQKVVATLISVFILWFLRYLWVGPERSPESPVAPIVVTQTGPNSVSKIIDVKGDYIGRDQINVSGDLVAGGKIQKKIAVVAFVESEDIHLGDNVYPERWGYNHNPLNITIYPQKAKGIVYYDKESRNFLSGIDAQTHIGQAFVSYCQEFVKNLDFSGYKFVSIYDEQNEIPPLLKGYIESKQDDRVVRLGPTVLYVNKDNKGNYYDRYAAVGIVQAIDFAIPLAKAGIEFSQDMIGSIECLIECYHGGIRPGQSQNFALFLNGNIHEIKTVSLNMREKEIVRIVIPLSHFNFKKENIAALFVLPWQEDGPKSFETRKGPVHFRDVGIVNAYFKVTEK
jgi:hypothetical protein